MATPGYKECPCCDGTGWVWAEVAHIDYAHGGEIEEVKADCPECGGSGEVEDWEDEEDL